MKLSKDLPSIRFGILLALIFTIACQKNGQPLPQGSGGQPGPYAPQPPGHSTGNGNILNGTSDSGGGNGIDGKVFESFAVDPLTLAAFKNVLKPFFDKISNSQDAALDRIVKTKTWYIAPIKLDTISKDVLGVSFIKTETQQIARQTMKEIWIAKDLFEKEMNENEQAQLILHEIVMELYLTKYLTISELCRASGINDNADSLKNCLQNAPLFDKTMPAEPAHPLTNADYENIRFVTGWIMQNLNGSVTRSDFNRVLFLKGFDKRLFKETTEISTNTTGSELTISGKELYESLKSAELSGNMPDHCTSATLGQHSACKVEVLERRFNFMGMEKPAIAIRVTLASGESFETLFSGFDGTKMGGVTDGNNSMVYTWPIADIKHDGQLGQKIHGGFLFFKKTNLSTSTLLILDSIVIVPGALVSLGSQEKPGCLARATNPKDWLTDAIILRRDDKPPTFYEQMVVTQDPYAICTSGYPSLKDFVQTSAQNGGRCVSNGSFVCTAKPGLEEGQEYTWGSDLVLESPSASPNKWTYFVDGKPVDEKILTNLEGQDFCALTTTEGKLPTELVENGKRTLPKSINSVKITEISWYVDTVFFEGKTEKGNAVGVVIYCGEVRSGKIKEQTSLERVSRNLKGILTKKD